MPRRTKGKPDGGEDARLSALYSQRVAEQDRSHPGYGTAWADFVGIVLARGGRLVVPPLSPDPLIGMLGTRGRVWKGDVVFTPLRASDCHRNAARLWRNGEAVAVGTGYALSDDGLWREHSWAVGPDGEVLETTEPRVMYFGVELRGEEARDFADWVDPEQKG